MVAAASAVTFVTAYIDVYDTYCEKRDKRMDLFARLAETGAQICLYISSGAAARVADIIRPYPNVKIMGITSLASTFAWQTSAAEDIGLPADRWAPKDTRAYMALMNAKSEFMRMAIAANPFGSTHFGWMDFGLAHVFRDVARSQEAIRRIVVASLAPRFFAIPGCHAAPPDVSTDAALHENIFSKVCWRFCGGFFLGDRESMLEFADLHIATLTRLTQTHRVMTWEVNVWALMNAEGWRPTWFAADHDDRMVDVPTRFTARRLQPVATRFVEYIYPTIGQGFYPGSASLVAMPDGRRVLNTRYVNYMLTDTGSYVFSDPGGIIITRNVACMLDENWLPTGFAEMTDPSPDELVSRPSPYLGLEDIRLFARAADGEIGCVATTVQHSPTDESRIVAGRYDVPARHICDCVVLGPPEGASGWEKNWAPLPGGADMIYRWNPMEVGRVTDGVLQIIKRYAVGSHILRHARGSTTFVPRPANPRELVGMVHMSEESAPRQYYHMLVVLNAATYRPLRRSEAFYFSEIGIEFCIGMAVCGGIGETGEEIYRFWISRWDRAPAMLEVAGRHVAPEVPVETSAV
jgi:hypothetical protein